MKKKPKKPTITISSEKANTIAMSPPPMTIRCEPPPPDAWQGTFSIRGVQVRIKCDTTDRDKALVEMTVRLVEIVKESFGIRLIDIVRC